MPSKCMREIQGKSNLVRVSATFELARVWSYRVSAVTTKEASGTEKKLFLGTIIKRKSNSCDVRKF